MKVTEQSPEPRARCQSNDLELAASVMRTAITEGYVLVGLSRHAYRRIGNSDVERVPTYESDMVHQLLERRLLREGGNHQVTHGGHEAPGRSVLVPRATRAMASRWSALRPIPSPRAGYIRDAATGRAATQHSRRR